MTKLETTVLNNPQYSSLPATATKQERQDVLDKITNEVIRQLTAEEISSHVREVYDETIDEYLKNPHTLHVVDELIDFMSYMPSDGGLVIDVGCGTGRDVLYMSVADKKFREGLMGRTKNGQTTLEKFPVPAKTLKVIGVDSSLGMLGVAQKWQSTLIQEGKLKLGGYPRFLYHDATNSLESLGKVDGIWSCAALFTHTPKECLVDTINSIAKTVRQGGVFYTTYTNGRSEGKYDKLLRSSTGRIKYFSHPDPSDIAEIARQCGLVLAQEQYSDMVDVDGKVTKKDLFVSQLYRKK